MFELLILVVGWKWISVFAMCLFLPQNLAQGGGGNEGER